jgi:hypothetical protein
MIREELRFIVRTEVQNLIENNPELLGDDFKERLDEGFDEWWKKFKTKTISFFQKIGGIEGVLKEIESNPAGWIITLKKNLSFSQEFKTMLAKVQEIVDQMNSGDAPPPTGLQLASKQHVGEKLNETSFERKFAEKKQKPNFLSSIAAIMMIISLCTDKVLLLADVWWIVICVGFIGMNALTKIILSMMRGKMNLQTAKMQMARDAGLRPNDLQKYINSKTSR